MTMWRNLRTTLTVAAAYAVALQATLLAAVGPAADASGLAAAPICAPPGPAEHYPTPVRHGHDCLAACLACCCGAPTAEASAAAIVYAPRSLEPMAGMGEPVVILRLFTSRAHRSRAPPMG
ncbi:MAG TPA: hypothetical protein VGJ20_05425 [Xanthobacteraceae bacterium]|jgi:hypothetical protein